MLDSSRLRLGPKANQKVAEEEERDSWASLRHRLGVLFCVVVSRLSVFPLPLVFAFAVLRSALLFLPSFPFVAFRSLGVCLRQCFVFAPAFLRLLVAIIRTGTFLPVRVIPVLKRLRFLHCRDDSDRHFFAGPNSSL